MLPSRLVRVRPLLGLVLATAIAACLSPLASCAAPTLPLPPPTALVEGPPDADGIVVVSGEARPGAFVGCLNERTEMGVLVRADVTTGAYTLRVMAESLDVLTLWQFEGTEPGGQRREVVVPEAP